MEFYDCNSYLDHEDLSNMDEYSHNLRVVATGETRAPKRGEWFIADCMAHKAQWDYDAYHDIGRLVRVKTTLTIVED